MSKVKSKKHDTFIDMTAMSDVTVLLLTFFMLTATFLPKEPIQVLTPPSVSEVKVPDYNVLTILIDPHGKIFLNLDRPDNKLAVLDKMAAEYNVTLNANQKRSFVDHEFVGVPMSRMAAFLDLPMRDKDEAMRKLGIPSDSTNNQLAKWVRYAREVNEDIKIAIKADQTTPYPFVHDVMNVLVDIKENRYSLVTTLRGMPEGF